MNSAPESASELLRRMVILAEFGELALRSDNLDEILTESCRLVGEALGTDLAKVVELQDDGETLLVRAGVGWKPGVVGVATINASDNSSEGVALRSGEPMISSDIATETRFRYAPFLIENGVKAVVNVPIIGGEGRPPYGILQVDSRKPRDFTKSDTAFLSGYANLIAATVDRLRGFREQRHDSRAGAMGIMAATLAHELNQPLEAIANYASGCENVLKASGFQAGKLQEGLQAISAACDRAGDIIRRLREMNTNHTLHLERFSLWAAYEDAVGLVNASGCVGVKIISRDRAIAWVRGDRVGIEQVIVNLLKNACEAARDSDRIGLVGGAMSVQNGDVRLTIKDNGHGIPADRVSGLFEWGESSKAGGMGIGLSISRTIIERNGGKISLDKTDMTGSTFSIWLPKSSNLHEVVH